LNKDLLANDLSNVEARARKLSAAMPELMLSARQIAHTLVHGSHGRKRAGPGETFWQFRPYTNLEPAQRIDWRRSASSDHLYVREKEWDTAHTFWIWIDLGPSMWFQSKLSKTTKAERACQIGLAMADLLARSGERVGMLGLMPPSLSQDLLPQIAQHLLYAMQEDNPQDGLPPSQDIKRFSEVILISDFLEDQASLFKKLKTIASNQVGGTLMHIIDPAEETFPYNGRVEFKDMQQHEKVVVENANDLRTRYGQAFGAHKAQLQAACMSQNWGHLIHHTDRPAREGLLNLYGFLSNHYYATGAMSHEVKNNDLSSQQSVSFESEAHLKRSAR